MARILNYFFISLLFSFSSACFSENCASSMDGYVFFSASINKKGQAGCGYRYCYYNCDYKHYRLNGKYMPEHGTWTPEDEGLTCYDSSRACTFVKKPKLPYQFSQ